VEQSTKDTVGEKPRDGIDMAPQTTLTAIAALVVFLFAPALAQNGEMDRFSRKPRPMHDDVPYLSCQVLEAQRKSPI
jgi:hypothetical protein